MKHETVRWVRQCKETLSRGISPDYLGGSWKKTRIIGDDGHFCAVIARLVKHPFREYHEYIRVLFKPGIKLPVVVLWLWGRAIKPLGYLPPVLFQNKRIGNSLKMAKRAE